MRGAASHRAGMRNLVHLLSGGFAFLLPWLTRLEAAGLAAAALLFNRYALPRLGGAALFRREEARSPWTSGIVLYPAAVLVLILLFGGRMQVAATAWVVMAAGDAAAGFFGRRFGRLKLPWNRDKSVTGSVAFALAAGLGGFSLLMVAGTGALEACLLALPTALFASVIESLPWRLNDNLTVPLLSALFLRGLLEIDPVTLGAAAPGILRAVVIGSLVNFIFALAVHHLRLVDRSGMIAGWALGVVTYGFAGWRGFAILVAFFLIGSAATRLGRQSKERLGIAQEKRGARSARHALANCGVPAYLAVLVAASTTPGSFALAFVCALATAAFDTVSSEVGQAYGGRPVLITSLRSVAAGTNGAISWIGTLAGCLAALAIGGLAQGLGLLGPQMQSIVVMAAFIGSTADSLLGATLESGGLLDNEAVNFGNTLVGALAGLGLQALLANSV